MNVKERILYLMHKYENEETYLNHAQTDLDDFIHRRAPLATL